MDELYPMIPEEIKALIEEENPSFVEGTSDLWVWSHRIDEVTHARVPMTFFKWLRRYRVKEEHGVGSRN